MNNTFCCLHSTHAMRFGGAEPSVAASGSSAELTRVIGVNGRTANLPFPLVSVGGCWCGGELSDGVEIRGLLFGKIWWLVVGRAKVGEVVVEIVVLLRVGDLEAGFRLLNPGFII